jgi:hypothetical protein
MRALILALFLTGCTTANTYTNAAIDAGRQAKDTESRLLVNALCAMGIGALVRNNSESIIEGVLKICANSGVTMEDIEEARE